MAKQEKLDVDERVQRSVRRTLTNAVLALLVLGLVGLWGSFGIYQLEPGQSAVLLRLGRHMGTVSTEGLHWTLPPPLVTRTIVNVEEVQSEDFGFRGVEDEKADREKLLDASMQTSDNNIIRLSFAVQYKIKDAFAARYRVRQPVPVLRDAAQAAIREVIGTMTIDGVLSEQRGEVKLETQAKLQDILDSYDSGLEIQDVQLQEVQPPAEVRAAFDDVIGATQDASRAVNEAEGYQNEVIPHARAEAAEIQASAEAYRASKVAEATGASVRFTAIAAEYRKAPDVTRRRLYLETMESILADVDKVIIESGTTQVLPYLPLGRGQREAQP
jgi:membrane protease subunit HflK